MLPCRQRYLLVLLLGLSVWFIGVKPCRADQRQAASLVKQRVWVDLDFTHPVHPARLPLFGPLVAPSDAQSSRQARLEAGQWAMFWVPALSRRQLVIDSPKVRALDLEMLRVEAPNPAQGIVGFLEQPLQPVAPGRFEILNPTPARRAFLVRHPSASMGLRVQGLSHKKPSLAWEQAWREIWSKAGTLQPPRPALFDNQAFHPQRLLLLAKLRGLSELRQAFPESSDFVQSLDRLERLDLAWKLRPRTRHQSAREKLCPHDQGCGFREDQAPFPTIEANSKTRITLNGPGVFEVRARQASRPNSSEPALLRVQTLQRRLGTLALSPSLQSLRFWLPAGAHLVELAATHSAAQSSLRTLYAPKRFSARLRGASMDHALNGANKALRKLHSENPDLAALLSHLLDTWRPEAVSTPSPIRAHAKLCRDGTPWLCANYIIDLSKRRNLPKGQLSKAITLACKALRPAANDSPEIGSARQERLAALAQALGSIDQIQLAQACLQDQAPISNPAYLQELLSYATLSPGMNHDPWLSAAYRWLRQTRAAQSFRRAFWKRWIAQVRLRSIRPPRPQQELKMRWLEATESTQATQAQPGWSKLQANAHYTTRIQDKNQGGPTVLRIALSSGPRQSYRSSEAEPDSAIVQIGSKRHRVQLRSTPRIYTWIVSPTAHRIQVHAPAQSSIYCDQPVVYSSQDPAPVYQAREMWPSQVQGKAMAFTLPDHKLDLPVSLKLRVAVSGRPERRRTLPLRLHSDGQVSRRLWIHYDPQTLDPSLQFGSFGPSSFPLSIDLQAPLAGAKLWITQDQRHPKIAIALQTRQARTPPLTLTAPDPNPQPGEVIYSTQGPEGPNQSAWRELQRALRLSQNRRWSELRDALEAMLTWPTPQLQPHRSSLAQIIDQLAKQSPRAQFEIQDSGGANPRRTLRAPFLDPADQRPAQSAAAVDKALQVSAQSLRETKYSSISRALVALADYMQQDREASPLDLLAYGMLQRIQTSLRGAEISKWSSTLARNSRWESIQYATQSAGHELLLTKEMPVTQRELRTLESVAAPWRDPIHSFVLRDKASKRLTLERPARRTLKVQGYCRNRIPSASPLSSSLSISLDRHQTQKLSLVPGKLAETTLVLFSGRHQLKLALRSLPERDCAFRVLEKDPNTQAYRPLPSTQAQRWFLGTKDTPVEFQAQGPGTLRLEFRSREPETQRRVIELVVQSPSGRRFVRKLGLAPVAEKAVLLERFPEESPSQSTAQLELLSEPGVYRFTIRTKADEILAKAATRVPANQSDPVAHLQGLVHALREKLVAPASFVPVEVPHHRPSTFAQFGTLQTHATPRPGGIWSMQSSAGLQADGEYEEIRPRWKIQADLEWLGALWPKRLWGQLAFRVSSENRVRPATSLRARLYATNKSTLLRYQMSVRLVGQPLNTWAQAVGVWARLGLSLRPLWGAGSSWDLRPELRFSYQKASKATEKIARGPYAQGLHASVFREYTQDHPFALRPRIELIWRPYYDLRASLGHDLWLNASFASLDRLRLWTQVEGTIDPFSHWNRVLWSYQGQYRTTFALPDDNRRRAFTRHELSLGLKAGWRFRPSHRWTLGAAHTMIFQPSQALAHRFILSASVALDRAGPLHHRPPSLKRFPLELAGTPWTYPQLSRGGATQ